MSILGSARRGSAVKRLARLAAATAYIAGMNAPVQSLELRVNVPVVAPKIKVPTPSLAPKVTLPALNSSKHDTMLSDKPTLSPSLQKKHDAMLSGKPTLSPPLRENDSRASAYESVVRVGPLHPVAPLLHLPSPYAVLLQNGADPATAAVVVILMMTQDGDKDLSAQMQQAESQMAAKQSIRNLVSLQQKAAIFPPQTAPNPFGDYNTPLDPKSIGIMGWTPAPLGSNVPFRTILQLNPKP